MTNDQIISSYIIGAAATALLGVAHDEEIDIPENILKFVETIEESLIESAEKNGIDMEYFDNIIGPLQDNMSDINCGYLMIYNGLRHCGLRNKEFGAALSFHYPDTFRIVGGTLIVKQSIRDKAAIMNKWLKKMIQ